MFVDARLTLCMCCVLCVVWLCTDAVSSASVLTVIIHRKLVLHCQYTVDLKVCHCLLLDLFGIFLGYACTILSSLCGLFILNSLQSRFEKKDICETTVRRVNSTQIKLGR